MVNGENPHIGFDFYLDTIGGLRDALPDVHLKCYTASEIHQHDDAVGPLARGRVA